MKVAIYAKVSTDDKGRDPLNQLASPVYEPAKTSGPSRLSQRGCLTRTTLR
jgi:hypothetical protein